MRETTKISFQLGGPSCDSRGTPPKKLTPAVLTFHVISLVSTQRIWNFREISVYSMLNDVQTRL